MIIHKYSPNFNNRKRQKTSIKYIIIHYTGMQSERESLKRLCDLKSKVSSHYFIGQRGSVFNLVSDLNIAWHAGKSCWRKDVNLNKKSIGIELANKGHRFGYTNFAKKQIFQLIKLCKRLKKKYNIRSYNIVGHSDIAPLRKIDPGEKFPWKLLAKQKLGIWHNIEKKILIKLRNKKILNNKKKIQFFKNIKKIGYCVFSGSRSGSISVIKAFQRHFRKELINGQLDQECLIISDIIAKKLRKKA